VTTPIALSYVLPILSRDERGLEELTGYLRWLASLVEVIVIDDSTPAVFERHRRDWDGVVHHRRSHDDLRFISGKVNAVVSGIREASYDRVILADDDVRYDEAALAGMSRLLDAAELVRPQNYYSPMPWHARWDTARSLINRAVSHDYPGTLGVRRAFFLDMGGYDGDVLFENLELMRTVTAAGGRMVASRDLLVRRLPPTTSHFWSQRVRQAYDDFALPGRMAAALALLPGLALVPPRRRAVAATGVALAAVALAEAGRRRGSGPRVFPPSASLFAPAWVAERAVCSWLAVASRLRHGGVRYGGVVMRRSASSPRRLRQRLGDPRLRPGPR
jgi:hypothetical protein